VDDEERWNYIMERNGCLYPTVGKNRKGNVMMRKRLNYILKGKEWKRILRAETNGKGKCDDEEKMEL